MDVIDSGFINGFVIFNGIYTFKIRSSTFKGSVLIQFQHFMHYIS